MAADITWTGGGAPDRNWTTTANWSGTLNNPTTDSAVFNNTDTSSTISKTVDVSYTVGGLRAVNNGSTEHILNLSGNTLSITNAGDLIVRAEGGDDARLTISNGTLTVTNNVDVRNVSTLTITNATLGGPFRRVRIGVGDADWGAPWTSYLDLRGGSMAGGVFEADDLLIGGDNDYGALLLGPGSLTTLRVHTNLYLNSYAGASKQRGGARIGDASGDLPPNVNIYVGSQSARGRLHVHYNNSFYIGSDYSRMAVSSGGDFEAWLDDLVVSRNVNGGADAGTRGTLDLRGLDSFFLDATEALIGTGATNANYSRGWVYFPAGTARVDRLYVGDDVGTSIGLLELSNTLCQIDDEIDVESSGDINVGLRGKSAGLDLSNDVTMAFSGSGKITVTFEQAADPGVDPYWGIRQAGNHAAVIGGYVQDGKIDLQIGTFTGSENFKTGVYYNAGYTYAAMVSNTVTLPPALTARDISVEVDGETTIRIAPQDIVQAEYNPESLTVTNRVLSHASYSGGMEVAYIDFPTSGPLPISNQNVTVKYYYTGGVSAEDTGDVVFVPLADPTTGDVTWDGEAREPTYLDRRQWKWGANWLGDQPPSNPTPATVTFEDYDNDVSVVKELPPIPDVGGSPTDTWTVGTFRIGNITGGHTLDLGGKTLKTTAKLHAERLVASGAGFMAITNGSIDVGTDIDVDGVTLELHDVDVTVPAANMVKINRVGTLRFTNNATLSGPFDTLAVSIEHPYLAASTLDMRGGSFAGGVLEVNTLRVGGDNANGYFYLGAGTLNEIRVHSNFLMNATDPIGGLHRGQGYIGDGVGALDAMVLPPDVSITIGDSASSRGKLFMCLNGTSDYGTSRARLVASSGGQFTAWLHELRVGRSTGKHAGPTGYNQSWLDLRGMTNCFLDATDVFIGEFPADGPGEAGIRAEVHLPSGEATIGTLTMGGTLDGVLDPRFATLGLNDTVCTVTNWAAFGYMTVVTNNVAGSRGSGLILPAMPAVSNSNVRMDIVFQENPTHNDEHFGLKIAGNQVAALQAATNTWLSWDDTALTQEAEIFYSLGYTYVGVPPPAGTMLIVR
jgi:hypothetical protein